MDKHTKEPWVSDDNGIYSFGGEVGVAWPPHKNWTQGRVAWPANRTRIVACVNAMQGIPDPAAFVKSHAELVGALYRLVSLCEACYDGGEGGGEEICTVMESKQFKDACTILANTKKAATGDAK